MMGRSKQGLLTLLGLALAAGGPAAPLSAQDTEWNRYTLEKLEGVFVRAEAASSCEQFEVSAANLVEEATKALEEAEVTLLSESEMLASPGLPDLRISVECSEGPDDTVGYSVWVRMLQAARMVRDPQLQLSEAVTWYASSLGVVDDNDTRGAVRESLEEALGQFATAFKTSFAWATAFPP